MIIGIIIGIAFAWLIVPAPKFIRDFRGRMIAKLLGR